MHMPMTTVLSFCATVLVTCAAVFRLWSAFPQQVRVMLSLGTMLLAAAAIGFAARAGIDSGIFLAHRQQSIPLLVW